MNGENATAEANPLYRLYYGDCLTIMRDMPVGGVDLIYMDPPFNSNHAYNQRDLPGRNRAAPAGPG